VNSGASEGFAVPAPLVAPVVLTSWKTRVYYCLVNTPYIFTSISFLTTISHHLNITILDQQSC
jgi:hypothetical protein